MNETEELSKSANAEMSKAEALSKLIDDLEVAEAGLGSAKLALSDATADVKTYTNAIAELRRQITAAVADLKPKRARKPKADILAKPDENK